MHKSPLTITFDQKESQEKKHCITWVKSPMFYGWQVSLHHLLIVLLFYLINFQIFRYKSLWLILLTSFYNTHC